MRNWEAYVRARLPLPELAPEREARIVRELAAQLEDFYREALAGGKTEDEADGHAQRQIGDWSRLARDVALADRAHARLRIERWSERTEDRARRRPGGWNMFADILYDARYALRQLARNPAFTIVTVVTLALGIGANTAIFSVVNGVLLQPLPYREPDRLVRVAEVVPQYGRFSVAPANFLDWRQQNTVFERIAAYTGGSGTLTENGTAERVANASVSSDTFELLGVAPLLGRGFSKGEETPGNDTVIVLSHGMWQRRFGGDPKILGRAITINGVPATIVGVMPPDFYFPSREPEYWAPLALNPANASRGAHFMSVAARLKPGVTVGQAEAEMKAIAERLARQYPDASQDESALVVGMHDDLVGGIRPALLTLLAAVGFVALIACGNVANLLLVRASVREKEIAIRTALGAGRGRIALQMLVESVVLACVGGALGLLLSYLAIDPIRTLSAGSIPRVADVTLDAGVLAFTAGLSLLTGLLFGLAPAWQAARANLADVMREGGRSSTSSGGRAVRAALVTVEVALSIVLLVGAALLLRSFSRLTGVDPGFRPDNVLTFRIALPARAYPEDHQRLAFYDGLLQRLGTLPGARSAGMVQALPLRGSYVLSFTVQGRPAPRPGDTPSANHRVISPDYFATLGIPLRRGRAFTGHDTAKAPMVAIVDEAFARRHFPDEDPIGRGIDIGNGTDGFYEIVGVVGEVRQSDLETAAAPTMYVPFAQDVFSSMWMVVRTDGDPLRLAADARRIVREIDPALPAYSILSLSNVISDSVAQRRFSMLLLTAFAGIAVFLAAVGLYGVVSYTVSQRTQEMGLRLAIGAPRGHLLRMVVGQGLKLVLAGVALGLAGALALARLVTAMLFEVTPFDPASYVLTAGALVAIAALACLIPARRAMRVDPIVALRYE